MQIRFEPAVLGSEKTRIISMYDCHVVYCRTSFNSSDNQPITDTVHITCGGVEDSYYPSTVYEEHWRITYPNNGEETVTDEEPKIINWHIEDKENNIIEKDEIEIDEEIIVVIETQNATGEMFHINLDSNRLDFEHDGKILGNDILDIQIKEEIQQIHLKAIKQQD